MKCRVVEALEEVEELETQLWQLPLVLRWAPREQNVEADALTNEDFSMFSEQHRIHVSESSIKFCMLQELLEVGSELFGVPQEVLKEQRQLAQAATLSKLPKGKRLKITDPW